MIDLAKDVAMGIDQLHQAFCRQALSPVTVLEALLAEIQADTHGINAFVLLDREAALEQAQAAERRFMNGTPIGVLDGIPVSVKDMIAVKGWPIRFGSRATEHDPVCARDAPSVAGLRAAGAVVFGKTTTTEFGWTIMSGNPHTGVTRNPANTRYSAGGSSSGAAAHVAKGWGPLALGSDAGGSVRIPAALCGVVGFKPSYGAIPSPPLSAFADFAHQGVLARTVGDAQVAFSVLSKGHYSDPSSLFQRSFESQPGRCLRIGWCDRIDADDVIEASVDERFHEVLDRLRDRGYWLEQVDLKTAGYARAIWAVWVARVFESFQSWPEEKRCLLDPVLGRVYHEGAEIDSASVSAGRAALRDFHNRLNGVFGVYDLLLTPTTSAPASRLPGSHESEPAQLNWFASNSFAFPFNQSHQPGISMPAGTSPDGLPIGLQIVGRKYADQQVLSFSTEIEPLLKRFT
ncbi:MAG TPA: amidase [Pusillimonas sp.]|jgi:Asp-tRNA(Asn)/Glu-tRNA(Gln) amidotransferase A subunit family amidase|nr:amidase [Pusillimonas sp.]|tara:strand:+ start:30489 stop:31868 length:1380 start_codon:yes stop_codon:yes gene_type:complete